MLLITTTQTYPFFYFTTIKSTRPTLEELVPTPCGYDTLTHPPLLLVVTRTLAWQGFTQILQLLENANNIYGLNSYRYRFPLKGLLILSRI